MSETYTVRYKFNREFNLVVEKHIGLIGFNKLIQFTEMLSSKEEFSSNANFLIDLRASKFSMNITKVKDFVIFLNENCASILTNKIAFLTEESEQVAMATLFKMLQPKMARNIQIFSTLEYALLWLNIEVSQKDMEELICCAQTIEYQEYK